MGGSVAIANAVYHATAKQVRDLRITVKKLLLHGYCPQRSDSHLARSSMSEMTGFGADAATATSIGNGRNPPDLVIGRSDHRRPLKDIQRP
jgi:hypothetical protein